MNNGLPRTPAVIPPLQKTEGVGNTSKMPVVAPVAAADPRAIFAPPQENRRKTTLRCTSSVTYPGGVLTANDFVTVTGNCVIISVTNDMLSDVGSNGVIRVHFNNNMTDEFVEIQMPMAVVQATVDPATGNVTNNTTPAPCTFMIRGYDYNSVAVKFLGITVNRSAISYISDPNVDTFSVQQVA